MVCVEVSFFQFSLSLQGRDYLSFQDNMISNVYIYKNLKTYKYIHIMFILSSFKLIHIQIYTMHVDIIVFHDLMYCLWIFPHQFLYIQVSNLIKPLNKRESYEIFHMIQIIKYWPVDESLESIFMIYRSYLLGRNDCQ